MRDLAAGGLTAADGQATTSCGCGRYNELIFVVGYRLSRFEEAEIFALRPRAVLAIQDETEGAERPAGTTAGASCSTPEGAYEQALEHYAAALAIREKALGPDHPEVAQAHNSIGHRLREHGRFRRRRSRTSRRAPTIREKALGPEHPDVAIARTTSASPVPAQGDYARSEAGTSTRALGIWQKVLGPDHPSVAMAYNNLGEVCLLRGDYDARAAPHPEQALQIEADGPRAGAPLRRPWR